ncbi:hypothetical protein [Leptospira yasudae]|uniref:hypothetical protein n=1 Tax=Leptospira yasudae TaxID=2202201 RepID=UPI0010916219|nr:hypothetical protein [Leptospira yasudae]TGM99690.1 hypothetical protein EHR10_08850 [Leptospira yasudae]
MSDFDLKEKEIHTVIGFLSTLLLLFIQAVKWLFKPHKEEVFNPESLVQSSFFAQVREITRLDVFLDRNMSLTSSEILFEDLVTLYKLAKEKSLESIKVEFAHYGTISSAVGNAFQKFIDHVSEFNGIRLVVKFPTDSPDAVKLYLRLQKHRSKTDAGRVELYLNDYSDVGKNKPL